MKTKDISDNEIKILGQKWQETEKSYLSKSDNHIRVQQKSIVSKIPTILLSILLVTALLFIVYLLKNKAMPMGKTVSEQVPIVVEPSAGKTRAYIETVEETVNDVPMTAYIPHNAVPELIMDFPDEADSSIVFIAPAADVSGNDYGIIGDFVLRGEQLARGVRKQGFCAIVDQKITIGVGEETPLLERVIREKGYFFRQYPLVKNGEPIENKPKGKSLRRAVAIRNGTVMMIESRDRESFHDFAQALADAGVEEAIYTEGGDPYRWYIDMDGKRITAGDRRNIHTEWKGLNFFVWRENIVKK
jgi:hypothetical protein